MKRGLTNINNWRRLPRKQGGAFTIFSAVLILVLLTEMTIYAVQVGVFEQRKSANEMRQKEAFHIADGAIQFTKQFMLANSRLAASAENDIFLDGADGWLPGADDAHWRPCADANYSQLRHPCNAEPADNDTDFPANLRDNMYFYMSDPTGDADDLALARLPIDADVTGDLVDEATQQFETYALLCMLDIERNPAERVLPNSIIQGCTLDSAQHDERYYMVTLLAVGETDCSGGTCSSRALIADKIGSFGPGGDEGGPGSPLISKSTFPPNGSADVVPNPNGGGVGVPVSGWVDAAGGVDGFGGSWQTCERHEWYEVDILPADFKCPAGSGNCTCAGKRQLSYPLPAGGQHLGIDIVLDDDFPPDLFKYVFGVTGDEAGIDYVKGLAEEVWDDCDATDKLNEEAFGLIWIDGDCDLPSGSYLGGGADKTIGSKDAPVLLVLAGANNRIGGNIDIYGTIFFTDVVHAGAEISGAGTPTIYGAMIIDEVLDKFTGNLKLVYVEETVSPGLQQGNFGPVAGAWSDFHDDWR